METVPTDFVDGSQDDPVNSTDNDDEALWGRLIPIDVAFSPVELKKCEYTFGRGEECDYKFDTDDIRQTNLFLSYSKLHFKLVKEESATGCHTFLVDCSSNGTFVNGEKIGKNSRCLLHNNDEIALAAKKNRVYVYMDTTSTDDVDLPKEVRDKYTLARTLGRGACGEVRLAFKKGSCHQVAIKIVQKKKFGSNDNIQQLAAKQVMNEVNILKSLKHPCIIDIEDVIDTTDAIYIVLELVEGGELFDRVVSVGRFDEKVAKFLFLQMVYGVKYLHDRGITHRDLKPENILLTSDTNDCRVKVTDFGLSKFVDANTMMKTFCGTPNYLAPEILLSAGSGSYTNAIDCWSLGVILFICLVGYPPFSSDRKDMELPKQIVGGHFSMPDQHWKNVSKEAKDLVKKFLTVDPNARLTLTDALEHPWLQDNEIVDKVHQLLYTDTSEVLSDTPSPKKRHVDNDTPDNTKKLRRNQNKKTIC